jgi:hypothetical protein
MWRCVTGVAVTDVRKECSAFIHQDPRPLELKHYTPSKCREPVTQRHIPEDWMQNITYLGKYVQISKHNCRIMLNQVY